MPNRAQQIFQPKFRFGLGGVSLGNEFNKHTDKEAESTLEAAWEVGVRYFDVAPWYGFGLAERRFGRLLHGKKRDEYLLSSKVGKLFKASKNNRHAEIYPLSDSPNDIVFDYTADGVRRSIEDSLQRLGVDSLDIAFVHDISPDFAFFPNGWEEQYEIFRKGAFPALSKMRDEGIIRAWGIGVNTPLPILKVMEDADPDVCLCARQYSLIDHASAVNELFPAVRKKPVRVLSKLFRRLMLEKLLAAHAAGRLQFFGSHAHLVDAKEFAALLAPLSKKRWFVYAKRPFAGPKAVLAYLSRYTHRVAISNRRLIAVDEHSVTFKVKDYRIDGPGRYTTMTLDVREFIRRFLIHVLPKGFHRIRHHGLLASGNRAETIARARELLGLATPAAEEAVEIDPAAAQPLVQPCPCCGGRMFVIETFEAGCQPRHRPTAPLVAIRIDTS